MTTTAPPHEDLNWWILDMRQRGVTLQVVDSTIRIVGGHTTSRDRRGIDRYRHALHLAAAGEHTSWWRYATGRSDRLPAVSGIPTVDDPDTPDTVAWACACCGRPATVLTGRLLPWCPDHLDPADLR